MKSDKPIQIPLFNSVKISKAFTKLINDNASVIASIYDERSTGDGIWINLKNEYICQENGCGHIHEGYEKLTMEDVRTFRSQLARVCLDPATNPQIQ